uniref:hypothetical protein n=1 Tax=Borreliella garinii TaxID=29519 RepID=UPI00358DCD16
MKTKNINILLKGVNATKREKEITVSIKKTKIENTDKNLSYSKKNNKLQLKVQINILKNNIIFCY